MSQPPNKETRDKRIHIKLDVDMLGPDQLKDEVSFESAMSVLEGHLANPAVDKEKLILDVLAMPNLFEVFVSAMSTEGCALLSACVTELFPSAADGFEKTIASVLLHELSRYCGAFQEPGLGLDDCLRAIELARPVLGALAVLTADTPEDAAHNESTNAKRTTQRMAKKAKRAGQRPLVDDTPFVRIGVPVPSTQQDAVTLAQTILSDQKNILHHYLGILRRPELTSYVKSAYTSPKATHATEPASQTMEETSTETFTVIEDVQEPTSPLPGDEPLTAALYFDSPEGFGDWRLIIPQRANKDLRSARKKSPKVFDIILKKLKELSHGLFSSDNQKRLIGIDNDIPIYEAKMTGDTRLVYRVDCEQEYGSDVVTQVLRVYGVYTHAQMKGPRFWDAVSRVSAEGGVEYRRRCLFRSSPRRPGDYAIPPAMWPPQEADEEVHDVPLPDVGLSAEEQQELHNLLVSEKFVPFSQAFLDGIITDRDVTHPFYMSPQEQSIVLHRGTSYVQGRSGTGKTTTMVFKMIGVERHRMLQQQQAAAPDIPRPRQLFVTQSRVLAEKVEEYFVKMSRALEVERQESDHRRLCTSSTIDSEMIDRDEEEQHSSSLPAKWSDLTDDHFPLFVTSDQLCRLLEADFASRVEEAAKFLRSKGAGLPSSEIILTKRHGKYISYADFQVSYWKRLRGPLTKGLDPSSIYSEFIGVIQGSERALSSVNGVLDRDTYCSLSHRASPFTEQQREAIYSVFEAYVKLKRADDSYDAADRTHDIVRNLQNFGLPGSRKDDGDDLSYHPGKKVDYVYVDETQDNLLVDTFVFRFICRRPDGLFWAGDTAQTISAGSTFRFNELKSFMYRLEKGSKSANARTFQLTKNYRSHGGIVKCAQTVVRLITRFWPQTIDNLQAEQGLIDGIKPTFFSSGQHNTPHFEQFLSGDTGTTIEFGARQCIIVYNDAAREQLLKDVGEVGLIFTVAESKGLEFEDVVIYNFFADSTATLAQWRIVLHELPSNAASEYLPTFDEIKHHVICRESKSLYVALTRARLNVWFIDYSEKGDAMKLLWQAQNQVSTWTPGMSVPRLTTASSREEWKTVGRELFENKKFMQAVYAFERAGLPRQRDVAQAYHFRELARQLSANDSVRSEQVDAFRVAAKAFVTAGEATTKQKDARVYFRISAQCYADAGDNELAGKYFEQAQEYTLSAQTYRIAGCFDDAVRLTKAHEDKIEVSVVENIVDISRLHYLRSGVVSKAKELFQTSDAALEFTEDYGLNIARATLLESVGRYEEAAEMHLEEGKVDEAVRVFLLRGQTAGIYRACDCILAELWKLMSLGVRQSHENPDTRRLLSLASRLPKKSLQPRQRDELAVFDAVASNNMTGLKTLGCKISDDNLTPVAAFLYSDHVFSLPFTDLVTTSSADFLGILPEFLAYTGRLRQLAYLREPCNDSYLQQLLAFENPVDGQCIVHPGTLLEGYLELGASSPEHASARIEVSSQQLNGAIRAMLRNRLVDRVRKENDACKALGIWREPCAYFVADGSCRDGDSCAWPHRARSDLPELYDHRMALILTQINVYEMVNRFERWSTRRWQQRFWLGMLYGACTSPFAGHLKTTPIGHAAQWAVKRWLAEMMFDHTVDPRNDVIPPDYISSLLKYFSLFKLTTGQNVPTYMKKLPCCTGPHPRWVFSGPVHVLHNFFSFTRGLPRGLQDCVSLLTHILDAQIPVDAPTLCDLLDDLSTAFIISSRTRTPSGRILHNVILPRKWLLRSTHRILDDNTKAASIVLLSRYLAIFKTLFRDLYSPDDRCHPSLRLGWPRRNILIARLCQNLALVGFNIQTQEVKTQVHLTLKSFCVPEAVFRLHSLYQSLVGAKQWLLIEDMVRRNTLKLDANDMVQLVHRNRIATASLAATGPQRIIYTAPRDIPGLLLSSSYTGTEPENARVAVAHNNPSRTSQAENRFGSLATAAGEQADTDEEDDMPPSDDEHDEPEPPMKDSSFATTLTDDDVRKIQRIAVLWAREVRRREREAANPMSKIAASRSQYFKLLLDGIKDAGEQGNKYYRMLYLGCVPHVLSCLKIASAYAREGKRATALRLVDHNLDHMELDTVQSEISAFNALSRKIVNFGHLLKPSAEVHRQADHETLRHLVYDVQGLIDALPVHVARECHEDMRLAILGMRPVGSVKQKVPPTSRQALKPRLQVEDEFDYTYADI